MPAELPELSLEEFEDRLRAVVAERLGAGCVEKLYGHYRELRRWNRVVSLVGPEAVENVVERHYGESLAALPLIGPRVRRVVDLGSGAGFPGLVLAAARPELEVTLVEPRERKWSFLMTVCRKLSLPCKCVNARVGDTLPEGVPEDFDLVTTRALKMLPRQFEAVLSRLADGGSLLLWLGAEGPRLPAPWRPGREIALPGSARRRIVEVRKEPTAGRG